MNALTLSRAMDEGRFGGKAVSLGRALRAGLPVPDGVALDVDLVAAVRDGNPAAVREIARTVEELDGPLAVRSSAVGEDAAGTSFAGQHVTVLNVVGVGAAREAVGSVHASAQEASALEYRRRLGVAGPPRMAAVLQRMLVPDVSGVLFTRDPLTGRDDLVIEATWGLGEALVGGLVTPDLYRIARDGGRLLESVGGDKHVALRLVSGGGTREVELSREEALRPTLGASELGALHALAMAAEQVYGPALDIEWVIAQGRLHLVQCRPITRAARAA